MNDVTVAVLRRRKRNLRKIESPRDLRVDDALAMEEEDLRDALKDPLIELALQPSVTEGDPSLPWGDSEPHRRTDQWQEFRDVLAAMHGKAAHEEESDRNNSIPLSDESAQGGTQRSSDAHTQSQHTQQSEPTTDQEDDTEAPAEASGDAEVGSEVDDGAPGDGSGAEGGGGSDDQPEAEDVLPAAPSLNAAPAPAPPPAVKEGPKVLPEGPDETPSTVAQSYASMRASDRAKQQHTLGDKVKAGSEALTAVTEASVPTYTAEMTGNEDKPVTTAVPVQVETGDADSANVASSKATEAAEKGLANAPTQRSTAQGRGTVRGMVRQAVASEEPTKRGAQRAVQAAHQGKDGINTNVQPPPIVLTGNADPEQAVEGGQMALDEANEALAKAQKAVVDGPGPEIAQTRTMVEDFTVPAMEVPQMPTFDAQVGGVEEYLSYELVTPDIEAAFDAEVETRMAASMAEVDKQAAKAQADFDAERDAVLTEAGDKVDEANKKAQADQEAATTEARADIVGKQQDAMDRQAAAVRDMQAEVRKEQGKVTRDIDARIKADQKKIDADMAKAKSKADAEVKKGEAQAQAKEAELEEEDDSWWDDVTDFVGDCIEAVTDAIMDVWNAVADAVCAIIDAAVEAANALIDAAIEWAKEAVDFFIDMAIGLVDGLLGDAFPELAEQLKAGLEYVREDLHNKLDSLGNWLKEQVAAAAQLVKDGIAAIGAVLEGALEFIGTIVMAALEGDWAEIGLQILKGVLSLAGISWEDFQVIVAKGMEIVTCLLEDPGAVVGNAIDAVGQGFSQFGENFMDHFVAGAIEWITGATGITLPESFDIAGVLDIVLQVLDLSVDKVKDKAREHLGDEAVDTMEKIYEYIEALWTGGFAAVWELLKGDLGSLWDDIIGGITEWITEKVIMRGVQFIATLSTGIGAIIEGVIAIYNFVMWLKDNIQKIWEVVTTVIDSVHEFVMGNITPAANKIEGALAGLIPVAIDLVMKMVGLNGLPKKIRKIIEGIRAKIDKALDKMFEKALDIVGVKSKKASDDDKAEGDPATKDAVVEPVHFTADGEKHRLWVEKDGKDAVVMMASTPAPVDVTIDKLEAEADELGTREGKLADNADGEAKVADRIADQFLQNKATADKVEAQLKTLAAHMDHLMSALPDEADAARNLSAVQDILDHAHWDADQLKKPSPFQGLAWESAIASAANDNALTQVLSGFAQTGRRTWLDRTKDPIAFVTAACKTFKAGATADGWARLAGIAADPKRDDLTVSTLQMAAGSIGLALVGDATDPRRTDFAELVGGTLKSVGIEFDEFLGERTVAPEFAVGWGPFALTMKRPKAGSKDYPAETGDLNLFKWDTPAWESPNFLDAVGAFKDVTLMGAPVKFDAKVAVGKIGAEFKAQALNDEEVGLNAKFSGDAFSGGMSAAISADVAPFLTAFELKGELSLKGGGEGEWTPVWNHKDKVLKGAQGKITGHLKGEGKLSAEVIKLSLLKLLGAGGDGGEADKKSFIDSFLQGNGLFKIDLLKRGVDLAKITKFFVAEAPGNKITLAGSGDLQVEVHPALKAAFDAAKGLFNKAQDALTKGWDAFLKGGSAALKGIKDAGAAVLTKAGEVGTAIGNGVVNTTKTVGKMAKSGLDNAGKAIKDTGKAIVDGTKSMLGMNTKSNKDGLDTKSDQEKKHQALVDGVKAKLRKAYGQAKTPEEKLKAVQSLMPTLAEGVNAQLSDGIAFTWHIDHLKGSEGDEAANFKVKFKIAPNDTVDDETFTGTTVDGDKSALPSTDDDYRALSGYGAFEANVTSFGLSRALALSSWKLAMDQLFKNQAEYERLKDDGDALLTWTDSELARSGFQKMADALLAEMPLNTDSTYALWSGKPSHEYAQKQGHNVLESTHLGKLFDDVKLVFTEWGVCKTLWRAISDIYARELGHLMAGTPIEVYQRKTGDIFTEVEAVRLEKVGELTGIYPQYSFHPLVTDGVFGGEADYEMPTANGPWRKRLMGSASGDPARAKTVAEQHGLRLFDYSGPVPVGELRDEGPVSSAAASSKIIDDHNQAILDRCEDAEASLKEST